MAIFTTKSHYILLNLTKSHWISPNLIESHRIWSNPAKSHHILENLTKSHKISPYLFKFHCISLNVSNLNLTKSHHISLNQTQFYHISHWFSPKLNVRIGLHVGQYYGKDKCFFRKKPPLYLVVYSLEYFLIFANLVQNLLGHSSRNDMPHYQSLDQVWKSDIKTLITSLLNISHNFIMALK